MKKFILSTLLALLFSYLSGAFLPWWTIAPVVAILHFLYSLKPGFAFLSGFSSLFFLWGGLALAMDAANHQILSKKIALIFLQQETPVYMIIITAVIGGLVGGLSALSGSLAKRLIGN